MVVYKRLNLENSSHYLRTVRKLISNEKPNDMIIHLNIQRFWCSAEARNLILNSM
jgi:hypothetical protein